MSKKQSNSKKNQERTNLPPNPQKIRAFRPKERSRSRELSR